MISSWQRIAFIASALGITAACVLPLSNTPTPEPSSHPTLLLATITAAILYVLAGLLTQPWSIAAALAGVVIGCAITLDLLRDPGVAGDAAWGFWLPVLANWLAAASAVVSLSAFKSRQNVTLRALDLAIPLIFGAVVIYLWEVVVRGFGVPSVLMPAPTATAARFTGSLPILGSDFVQTFVRSVLAGYAIGCAAGFTVAVAAHRFSFLGRGLLPIGNFVSALPIVGIAPIMVMWFGFDWPSKAAVVTIITFFPMLVNTLVGLDAAGHIERDLMRSYGAGHRQTLIKLYLPAAMPFIFNGLKINSTLAFIGAIVAEFFGTPTVGIGFRISIEAGRMALDVVWAEIALAALSGMAFYGIVVLAERATTFWHPSYRT
jgi:NitT/TauT family transport system permease protein